MKDDLRGPRIRVLEDLRGEFVRIATKEALSSGARVRRRFSPIALAGLLSIFLVAATITFFGVRSGRESNDKVVNPSMGGTFAAHGPTYETLRELRAVSDLIIVGTVEEVLPREAEGDPPEQIHHLSTVVSVDEVWKGSIPDSTVTVKTLELAYAGPNAREWRRTGQRVVLLLSPSTETPGVYIPANVDYYQTAYVVVGDDLIPAYSDDGLARQLAALSIGELRERMTQGP